MTGPITSSRDIESLKMAAAWPGADRATVVTLATRLAATGRDAEGHAYFQRVADASPGEALPLTLAGFFQARAGQDVEAGLAKLDKAATEDLGLPQFFRGLALAGRAAGHSGQPGGDLARQRAEQAVADLEFVLAVRDQFPPALLRAVHHGLASAYAALGQDDRAAEALSAAGLGALPSAQPGQSVRPGAELQFGGYWATAQDGFRFTTPRIWRPEPGLHVAQGYDFGDFAFVETSAGVVAIDAGTSEARVRTARADLGLGPDRPITHLILTHSHFDHAGGAGALLDPGTTVIAQAAFPAELERQRANPLPFRYFTGTDSRPLPDIAVDQLVAEPTALTIGDTEFVLYPTPGGETGDALLVHLPGSGVLFTGDVMMPYLGAPFFAEGSPEGLLDTLAFIRELAPRLLIQGHTPLTEQFTVEAVPGLEGALADLRGQVLDGIGRNLSLADILDRSPLPEVLRDHPAAVLPYLVIRDNFTARLYDLHTGYWKPDRGGMAPATAGQRAAALDLLAGGRADGFAVAARALIGEGNPALALELIEPGLARHPDSAELAELRSDALYRLMAQTQQLDPFRFLVYAELAGVEFGPVR